MTRFIVKELRALALPAGVVFAVTAIAALGARHGLAPWLLSQDLSSVPSDLARIAFLLGTPLVAATAFGDEFRHRTMTLLLTEPLARGRVWRLKWSSLVAVLAGLAAIEVAFWKASGFPPEVVAPGLMFLVMVACSAPLWTLLARSTVGGLALTLATIMSLELALNFVSNTSGGAAVVGTFGHTPAREAVRAAYSLVTLWLGWRVFATFQVVGAGFGDVSTASTRAAGRAWLRPRLGSPIGNLVRKELMLQRPTFLVAAAFVAYFLLALLLVWAARFYFSMPPFPELSNRTELALWRTWWASRDAHAYRGFVGPLWTFWEVARNIYTPLVVGLAGIISVGEDGSLGVLAWHLAVPVSARRQWAVKLAVSLLVGLVLVVGLGVLEFGCPLLMEGVLSGWTRILQDTKTHVVRFMGLVTPVFLMVVTGAIVVGFWASTLLRDTVKSAAAGLCAVCAISATMLGPGRWLGDLLGRRAEVVSLAAALNLSPRLRLEVTESTEVRVALFVAAVCIPALWQSLIAFRRGQVPGAMMLRMSLSLLAVAFLTAFGYYTIYTALWCVF